MSEDSSNSIYEDNVLYAAKGSSIVAIGRLFEYLSRIVIAFLLARLLGAEQLGLYSLALSVGTVAATISIFGLDDTVMRYVAVFSSHGDDAGVWGTLQFCIGLVALLSLLLGFGVFMLADPIAVYFFHSSQELASMLRLVSLLVPFLALSENLKYATRGFKKMEYAVIAENFVQVPFRLVMIGVLSLFGLSSYTAAIAFGVSDLSASIVLVYFLNKEFSLKRPLNAARRPVREFISFSFPLYISDLLGTFRGNLQTLLLGSMSSITSVGIFSVVDRIYTVGHMPYISILTSTKPLLAELQARDEWKHLERIYQITTRWVVMLNIPVFLTLVLFPRQVLSIFGDAYVDGAPALILLAWAELVNVGTGLCGSVIDMTGHTRLKLFNSGSQIAVSFGLNFWLIPRWGIVGAGTAAFASIALVNLLRLVEVWLLYRLLPYNREIIKPILAGLTAFIAIMISGRLIPIGDSFLFTIVQIAFIFLIFLGVIWLLGLTPEDRTVLAGISRKTNTLISKSRVILKRYSVARSD